ncbi:hypothetical protein PsYK624_091970 [Phanerochaete sordida]|uniref:Uncharacterized protein n=1 Tax=Phanerochaete sordida TaxID=48140 RepID=A0A9P3GDR8_9APHY|nr:hypothetical protein PsYK624_091970 [Phanerochaete sordida]
MLISAPTASREWQPYASTRVPASRTSYASDHRREAFAHPGGLKLKQVPYDPAYYSALNLEPTT